MSGGWHFDHPIELDFSDSKWTIAVKSSQVYIVILGQQRPDDLPTFANDVAEFAQGCIDSLGFLLSAALRLEMRSITIDSREIILPQPRWPELVGGDSPDRVEAGALDPLLRASMRYPLVRLALADIRAAMTSPTETGFFAYRATESVRQHFVGELDDRAGVRARSWQNLRSALGITEEQTRRLESLAKPRRHGESSSITSMERFESMVIARLIIQRFVAYLNDLS